MPARTKALPSRRSNSLTPTKSALRPTTTNRITPVVPGGAAGREADGERGRPDQQVEDVLAAVEAHAERMVDRQAGDGEAGVEDAEDQGQPGGVGVGEPEQDERDHRDSPDHVDRGVQGVRVGESLR